MSFSRAIDAVFKTVNSVFGTSATYTYSAGGPTSTLKGVFDNAFVEINGVTSRKPIFKIRLADLTSSPVEGDTILINSVNYTVRDSQADGLGSSTLILEKV